MNLLEFFILQHVQVSLLKAELEQLSRDTPAGRQEAKVELNLTPRVLNNDEAGALPAYQVSARLNCRGGSKDVPGPRFNAAVGFEVIYQQIEGEAIDLSAFSSHHASLTRQLYPILQQEMRLLLTRLGLEQVQLPFDLAPKAYEPENESVRVSGSVH
jgi:hypothetical protein